MDIAFWRKKGAMVEKMKRSYRGKYFSILGDSISTLAGYNPQGYSVFYDDMTCQRAGIKGPSDTWWGKVIDLCDGALLVNNSWSGSCVAKLPEQTAIFPSGCSDERTSGLHIGKQTPDVIIIYLGYNDWAKGMRLSSDAEPFDGKYNCAFFDFAYGEMLSKLRRNYPHAEIWCCTLGTTFMSSAPSFKFPYEYGGTHIEKFNKMIKAAAASYHCKLIDLYEYHMPYDAIDGSHPNAEGMKTLAAMVIKSLGGSNAPH